jgi:diguanylate cyclase (GGDEF)-like protein
MAPAVGESERPTGATQLPRGLPERLTARPATIAWSLALLFLFKGIICFVAVAFPISAAEPKLLVGVVGGIAVLAAGGVWLLAQRISLLGYELLAAAGCLLTSFLIAHAQTHGGMMIAAFAYPWIAIYSAHFFPRRAVNVQGLLISVGFGVALLASHLSHVAIYWLVVTITIWSICVLLGNLSESLRQQVGTDHLTGLLNRGGFLTAALRERARANRTGAALTIAVIDLDNFKSINDRAGHAAGDQLLASLGRRWRERMRPSDILARHGGDEFVVLLPHTTVAEAETVLERLHSGQETVAWSIGVSEWLPNEGLDPPLARADTRLYEAKRLTRERRRREIGPGRVAYTPSICTAAKPAHSA